MLIKKNQWPVFIFTLTSIVIFMFEYYIQGNKEFFLYTLVLIIFVVMVILTNQKVNYPTPILWGLSLWLFIHLAGGGIRVGTGVLYGVVLIPIVGDPYYIFRYDHFAHTFGFAVATLLMYYLLKPYLLIKKNSSVIRLGIVLVMAGLGAGAINEILEFTATVLFEETGVGGYINTSLDLIFNLVGALCAWIYIYFKEL